MNNFFNEKLEAFKKDNYNYALFLLLGFHAIIFAVFQILDQSNQTWDSAGHIGMSYNIAEQLNLLTKGQISIVDFFKTSDYYPPFVQTLGAILAMIFGYSSELILFLSLFFYGLAIVFVYINVRLITKDSRIGFLSALVFSLFPQIFEQSRIFHLDLPLIALLLISLYCFIRSKYLTETKFSIAFAIFFSLAQLTKWYGFIYLLIPCLLLLISNLQLLKTNYRKFLMNILIFIGIVAVLALPWYFYNYSKILEYSRIFAEGEIDDPTDLLSPQTIMYYPQRILSHQIFLLPFVLVIIGIFNELRKNRTRFIYIFLSILTPILIFTLIGNKNLRYVLPLAPLFAYLIVDLVFSSWGVTNKILSIFRKFIGLLLMVYLFFAFFFTSFNQVPPMSESLKYIGMVFSGPYNDVWYYEPQLYSFSRDYWPVKEVWTYIKEDSNNFETGFGVTPLLDKKHFSLATFELIRRENKFKKAFVPVPYFQFEPFNNEQEILDYFDENAVKYVLVTDNPGPEGLRNYKVLEQMNRYLLSRKNVNFEKIKSFDLPDGSQIHIFKKLPEGKTLTYNINTVCKPDAGKDDGIESIQLVPYHTYVFFTGHYAVDKLKGDFKEGKLYILQIENVPHRSMLDVYNLPHSGTGMCEYDDLDIDVMDAIRRPLTEPGHCAVDCQEVVHMKWSVGSESFEEKVYTRADFPEIINPTTEEEVVGFE